MKAVADAKSLTVGALVALNVFLLIVVVNRYSKPNAAMAQAAVPSTYLTAPGTITGQSDGVVFVLDTRNAWLTGMSFNSGSGQFGSFPPVDVNRAFQAGAGAVGNGMTGRNGRTTR